MTPNKAQQNKTQPKNHKSWYQVPMLWLVITLPIVAVIASIGFATLAFKTSDSVVRDDWYMDGKTLRQDLSRDVLSAKLGLDGQLTVGKSGRLELVLTGESEQFALPKQLTLNLYHATEKTSDKVARFNHIGEQKYLGQLLGVADLRGKYYFELTDGVWRLRSEAIMPKQSITFAPLAVYRDLVVQSL